MRTNIKYLPIIWFTWAWGLILKYSSKECRHSYTYESVSSTYKNAIQVFIIKQVLSCFFSPTTTAGNAEQIPTTLPPSCLHTFPHILYLKENNYGYFHKDSMWRKILTVLRELHIWQDLLSTLYFKALWPWEVIWAVSFSLFLFYSHIYLC